MGRSCGLAGRGLMLAGVCDFERGVGRFARVETVRQSDLWGGESGGRQNFLTKM
jgi:hypothetical protein